MNREHGGVHVTTEFYPRVAAEEASTCFVVTGPGGSIRIWPVVSSFQPDGILLGWNSGLNLDKKYLTLDGVLRAAAGAAQGDK